SGGDAVDLNAGEVLAVSLGPLVVLAPLELEHDHLTSAPLEDDLGVDLRTGHRGGADLQVSSFSHCEDLFESDLRTLVAREALHAEDVALLDSVLLTACANDRVHAYS